MIYRRITLDVACDIDEDAELMPAILTTLGAVETPYIGGTGIMILNLDETPLQLREQPQP
jgi:hypothetical protein